MRRDSMTPILTDAELSFQQMEAAIRSIDRRVAELDRFDISIIRDNELNPSLKAIEVSLKDMLIDIFGSSSNQYNQYCFICNIHSIQEDYYDGGYNMVKITDGVRRNIEIARAVLVKIRTMFSEKLEDSGRTSSSRPLRAYEFLDLHPEIERQIGALYRDGHYSEAVEKAVKVLNNLVRLRSGEESDGTPLMQKVFTKNSPIIKFNSLSSQSDQDEQQGFMYLFMGAVMGLRNPRAHRIINDDPERALEFIAFISLLAKTLDAAST